MTGGKTVAAAGLEKVPQIAADISRQVRNQCVLGYRPRNTPGDSKWRKIKVQVTASAQAAPVQTHYKKVTWQGQGKVAARP